jgi:maleamate amidohydrolase
MNEEDIDGVYKRAGLTHQLGFGQRPALLIVDMQIGFTEPAKSKIAGDFGSQIEIINKLISVARGKETPVIFTAIAYEAEKQADGGLWVNKIPALHSLVRGSELVEIDSRLRSDHEDLIIYKNFASAFFGTGLYSILLAKGIDTLIVTGCTTSGCIRATVVDAISYGFHPIIPLEAIGDRAQKPHEAGIYDINAKYGDVVAIDVALDYLRNL